MTTTLNQAVLGLSPAEARARVLGAAVAIGFDDCRIAAVHRATHATTYKQWVADGCHGDMGWMARNVERRSDPSLVLAGARSMVVVALNYFQPPADGPGPRSGPPRSAAGGRIARYAWGDDYHEILEEKLRRLETAMAGLGGRQKVYVDTGPVLERDFASDAGLGWNGKSTMQIHRLLGTWFFLGEILTTLELAPDAPSRDYCGTCTRCIEACPTQAITAPRRLDARRCLSYLTIEHKGPIPLEFRRALGARIYGCDDCLAVCPWNRFAVASREAGFAARAFVHDWLLRDFLALDDAAFRLLFKNSPIKRLKRPGFLRNVCVALGNVGTSDDLPALRTAAADPHPLIAEHAAWAISEIELNY
jgi:epoxyqueuosine reductase